MDYRRSTHHETNESNNPSAPVMYPQSYGNFSPYGGPRNEVEMTLLPQPEPPPRADRPITIQSVEKAINDGIKRDAKEDTEGDGGTSKHAQSDMECGCNYNRYATRKTMGHGMLEFALLTSNAMQLRTLFLQKHRNAIWIISIILVCCSILLQIGLAFLLVLVGKGDIRNPLKQTKLERLNNLSLFLILLISSCNVVINAFMTTSSLN